MTGEQRKLIAMARDASVRRQVAQTDLGRAKLASKATRPSKGVLIVLRTPKMR